MQAFKLLIEWDDHIEEHTLVAKDPIGLAVAMTPILDKLGEENFFRTSLIEMGKAKGKDYSGSVRTIAKQ